MEDSYGLKRDCTTCHFNFGEGVGCAAAHYGVETSEIMKDKTNFPCGDYKIALSIYLDLAEQGKIKIH